MKRYNIFPKDKEFSWGKMKVVELGESGRGRWLELIPFHALEDAELLTITATKSGKPKIVKSSDSKDWLAYLSSAGCYTRGTYGWVYVEEGRRKEACVFAVGEGAYGAAGRIGGWIEVLAKIPDNTLVKIKPVGGYKTSPYYLWFSEKEVTRIEEEEIDLFLDQQGKELPEFVRLDDVDWRKEN